MINRISLQDQKQKDPRYKLAEMLMQPQSGRITHPMEGIANLAKTLAGKMQADKLDKDYQYREDTANDTMAGALKAYTKSQEGGQTQLSDGNTINWDKKTPQEAEQIFQGGLASNPDTAPMATEMMMGDMNARKQMAQALAQKEAELKLEQQFSPPKPNTVTQDGVVYDLNTGMPAIQKPILPPGSSKGQGTMSVDPDTGEITQNYSNKPLPVGALKIQQDALDAIGAAGNIQNNAALLSQQLQGGNLEVGPIENMISTAKNWAGMSDTNSQAYANLKTTIEKIRNDSLRLNKGVQTEGDAIRALNEVTNSMNDPVVLQQALEKLGEINKRAEALQRVQVDTLRQNYNVAPFDYDQLGAMPQGTPPQAPQAGTQSDAPQETPRQRLERLRAMKAGQ